MTKILVCDDHRLVAESLALVLEREGHEVVAIVEHPREALAALDELEVDVCVMDLRYGNGSGVDGIDGIATVAERHPHLRLVVLSGHLEGSLVDEVSRAGASAWGLKRGDLASVVGLVLGDRDDTAEAKPLDRWDDDPLARFLTTREREVLRGLARGETTVQIARRFRVSETTVRTHTQSILTKLGVHTRLEAVSYAVGGSLIRVEGATGALAT